VAEAAHSGSQVALPAHVVQPVQVYVNGVLQEPGRDYELRGRTLVFGRELRQEGRLGFWRWTSILFGAAGTYRRNDVVDVIYEAVGGRRGVASNLPVEPAA
jgi:hypothetical protein